MMDDMKTCKLAQNCRFCGNDRGLIVESNNMHPARVNCSECGNFHKWLNKAQVAQAIELGLFTNK
jgi:ribosomal protein S14